MSAGHFIQPDKSLASLADPAAKLNIKIHSGYNAVREMDRLTGSNPMFDDVIARIRSVDLPYEDQCSALYYFDIARAMRDFAGQFSRVVEVGVFMGGSSAILAGCSESCDFDLDMVDINETYLLFAYERIRRTFPAAAERVRLFHGDLASYVRNVMMAGPPVATSSIMTAHTISTRSSGTWRRCPSRARSCSRSSVRTRICAAPSDI